MKRSLLITIIVIAVVVIAVIIGFIIMSYPMTTPSPIPNPNPTTNPTGTGFNVRISNFAFSPASLSIKTGDTVIWTNQDSVAHTVISDSGSEISSTSLSNGATYSHTFTKSGTYKYHCSIHPSMHGTITVA